MTFPPVDPLVLWTFAGLLGLAVGSFLNVVAHRLPLIMERDLAQAIDEQLALQGTTGGGAALGSPAEDDHFGLLWPPSRCPTCGHRLGWSENIPLFSYLVQRGRCKACATPIGRRYPIVEALTAALFLIVAWRFEADWLTLAAWGFTACLLALALIDLDHQILPDPLIYGLLWSGLLLSLTGAFATPQNAIIGAAVAYFALYLLWWTWLGLFGREALGLGDAKLLAALGAWFGWQALPTILLLAALLGIAGHLIARLRKSSEDGRAPFGPALAAIAWLYAIWGPQMAEAMTSAVNLVVR